MKNGLELKYKGRIEIYTDDEFPNMLCIDAQHSLSYFGHSWHSNTWDKVWLDDIELIRSK